MLCKSEVPIGAPLYPPNRKFRVRTPRWPSTPRAPLRFRISQVAGSPKHIPSDVRPNHSQNLITGFNYELFEITLK